MKLLIVEDDPKTARYLQKGLTEAGYIVDSVATGPSALRQLAATDYGLVILDVMLPGTDGWTVLSKLRQDGGDSRDQPVTERGFGQPRVTAAKRDDPIVTFEHFFGGLGGLSFVRFQRSGTHPSPSRNGGNRQEGGQVKPEPTMIGYAHDGRRYLSNLAAI